MNHSICIVCGASTDVNIKVFFFRVPICNGCQPATDLRREEIVAAIVEVLRA